MPYSEPFLTVLYRSNIHRWKELYSYSPYNHEQELEGKKFTDTKRGLCEFLNVVFDSVQHKYLFSGNVMIQ